MERKRENGLVYYQFEQLAQLDGVKHAVFTRRGGVSSPPFDSLNVGSTVGDDPNSVAANRVRMAEALGLREEDSQTTWQVHGAVVVTAAEGPPIGDLPPKADGIITDQADVPLVMRFADCVPLIFYDPVRRVVGLAHAGWRGTVAGIGPATVRAMAETYGSRPEDIFAGVGPSIGPCHYEVGPEVVAQVREAFGSTQGLVEAGTESHGPHLDLWEANRRALEKSGVRRIGVSGLCTACHTHEFFSHRAEAGRTGRFGAVIVMPNGHNGKA